MNLDYKCVIGVHLDIFCNLDQCLHIQGESGEKDLFHLGQERSGRIAMIKGEMTFSCSMSGKRISFSIIIDFLAKIPIFVLLFCLDA